MKIVKLELNLKEEPPVIISVDRTLKQPDRNGYTYGHRYNTTYCRELNTGPAKYDLLRDIEFLMFPSHGNKRFIICREIFDHFWKIDRMSGGLSELNGFLGLEDLNEIRKKVKILPRQLQGMRLFGWQSVIYAPKAEPRVFVPYVDIDAETNERINLCERVDPEKGWFCLVHPWMSDTFLAPRFRTSPEGSSKS